MSSASLMTSDVSHFGHSSLFASSFHLPSTLPKLGINTRTTKEHNNNCLELVTPTNKAQQQAYFSSLIRQMSSTADNQTRAQILRKLADTVASPRNPGSLSLPPLHQVAEQGSSDSQATPPVEVMESSTTQTEAASPSFVSSPPLSPSLEPLSLNSSPFSSPPSSPSPSSNTRSKRQKKNKGGSTRRAKKAKKEPEAEQPEANEEIDDDFSLTNKPTIEQEENDEDALGLKPTDKNLDLSTSKHTRETFFGKQMTVLQLPEVGNFLIGREVATLLRRQTFNMYRSMKLRGIGLLRALPEHVEHFAVTGVVKVGTHSVTLVPYTEGSEFIKECKLREIRLDKKKRKQQKSGLLELYLIANEVLSSDSLSETEKTE